MSRQPGIIKLIIPPLFGLPPRFVASLASQLLEAPHLPFQRPPGLLAFLQLERQMLFLCRHADEQAIEITDERR